MNNPQITPYKFPKELQLLYDCFYHSKYHDRKQFAIAKVRSYLTKGPIPHSIEMTALLAEAIISDERQTGVTVSNLENTYPNINTINTEVSDLGIRMQYSMSIIKFVNGLLDPFQQSIYNISLHKLALELNLPNYFVETRHAGTHERLPSLEMMRLVACRALNWLRNEYWEVAINQYKASGLLESNIEDWIENIRNERKNRIKRENENARLKENKKAVTIDDMKRLETVLKNIKKIRKEMIQNNQSKSKLSKELDILKLLISQHPEFVIRTMIFKNYLVLHGEKFENLNEKQIRGIHMIWIDILRQLDSAFLFKLWKMFFKLSTKKELVKYDTNYVEKKILHNQDINYLQSPCEYIQSIEWTKWILMHVEIVTETNIENILNLLMQNTSEISKKCLETLQSSYDKTIRKCGLDAKVLKMSNIMNKFWVIDPIFSERELYDVDSDAEDYVQNKRVKPSIYLFETFESWRPVPFGCPP